MWADSPPAWGGFCLPASRIARLFDNAQRTKARYNVVVTLAALNLLAIIALPIPFLYQLGIIYLVGYLSVVFVYALAFLLLICPVCATQSVCPGGQVGLALRRFLTRGQD